MNIETVNLLQRHPLPPDLKPYQEAACKLPFHVLFDLILHGTRGLLNGVQIGKGIMQAADMFDQKHLRCVACFRWVKYFSIGGHTYEGGIILFPVCPKCYKRIQKGQGPRRMAENLASYLSDEIEKFQGVSA